MAEGSNRGECSTSSKRMGMDTDPNSTIPQFLTNCDDYQLFQLTKFYRDRLVQAMEGGVDGVSLTLTYERIFTGQEHGKVTELVDKGNRADSSKLLLNLVMEKGSRARRVMWESFVRMRHGVPKLDKILKETQELGADSFDYINIAHGLSELPTNLKDLQQKHKETLRVQTETLRVNTILIKEKVKIFQLVGRYAELTHKLLPGCSVLVTSRPTALHLLEKADISVWAEILGFVGDERKEYFNKFFEDQTVAAAVFKHVEENEILYTMCYNPSYCWILGLSLGPFFTQRDRKRQQVPKTITQLYSYYIYNILKNHGREIETPRDVLLKLGEMAYTGVSEKKIVFRNGDLIKYKLEPSQFLSGFLVELLEKDESAQSVVYTFPHLTIQEFVAALSQFLTPDPGEIGKLLSEAHSEEDGRFEIFLRFVAGLSSPQSARPLVEFLGPFLHQTTCRVIDWVKEKVEGQIGDTQTETGKRKLLNTFHYLFESQNKALARNTVGSMEKLSFSGLRLTPIDCAVLSHVIGLCDTIKHLDLQQCYIQCEGLQRLGPVLHKCQELSLGRNKVGDSGVKVLSAALRNPECKIQKLHLRGNALTDSCAEDLASALSTNRSLIDLNLGDNKLGDSGVKLLSVALRNPDCKIQELHLFRNALTDSCAEDLASALSTNRSLIDLNLGDNKLGDSGVKLLSVALRNPDCKIQKLDLFRNALTDSCAEDLASALSTNRSLIDLNLGDNKLGDSGVKLLSVALRNPDCKIQKLDLFRNALTDSCAEDLASALSTNRSLIDLNLGSNKLGDSGVKLLSVALRNPDCKIQKLDLYGNALTDSCAEDLASALSPNRSLIDLNLGYNKLGDSGVKLLSVALRNPDCKIQKLDPVFSNQIFLTGLSRAAAYQVAARASIA
ncbi:NACHT, LRR and PYD domains-containing protein 3-like [Mustelus asterias]